VAHDQFADVIAVTVGALMAARVLQLVQRREATMRMKHVSRLSRWRVLAIAAISGAAITAIVGCDGSIESLRPYSGPPTTVDPFIDPIRQVVPAGDTATFNASVPGATSVTYQWLRNGVEIAGATAPIYRLVGANVGDDGALFSVRATIADGRQAVAAPALLRVSSAPGLVFADGDFAPSNWVTTISLSEPSQNGPTVSASQQMSGGNPDAFLEIVYAMPAGAASLHVVHTDRAAAYDPSSQGPLLVVDFGVECRLSGTGTTPVVYPLVEQGGRRFRHDGAHCSFSSWTRILRTVAVSADDFSQLDGPDCGAVACKPDFSVAGAPLRFGFVAVISKSVGPAESSTALGIDNWKATAWRR
jgi:hypothetical protein